MIGCSSDAAVHLLGPRPRYRGGGLNIIAHFAFLPHSPMRTLTIIALDVIVSGPLAGYCGETG